MFVVAVDRQVPADADAGPARLTLGQEEVVQRLDRVLDGRQGILGALGPLEGRGVGGERGGVGEAFV